MKKIFTFLIALFAVSVVNGQVIISEVTDNPTYAAEFVELVNNSTTPVDLLNWTLSQEGSTQNTAFSSTITTNMVSPYTLNPGEYVVVVRGTLTDLTTAYPAFSGYYFTTNSTSSGAPQMNGGESYILKDQTSTAIDYFGEQTGFVTASSKTYERNDAQADGKVAGTWTESANTNGTPGLPNNNAMANLFIFWTGTTSTDWETSTNWQSGVVPGSTDNVVIPATTNLPIISRSVSITNLAVSPGAALTIDGGDLSVSNPIYLEDDDTGLPSGQLVDQSTASPYNGTIEQQLYMAGGRAYQVSPSVTSVEIGNAIGNPGAGSSAHSWNAGTATWDGFTALTDAMTGGFGYRIKPTNNVTAIFTGTPVNPNYVYTVFQDGTNNVYGWNLVGNPYPCAINWDLVNDASDAIYNSIYFWNGTSYAIYQGASDGIPGVSTNGGSNIIPAMQAFFVRAKTNGASFSFPVTMRTANLTQNNYKSSQAATDQLRLALISNEKTDEAVIRYASVGQVGEDDFDAKKLFVEEADFAQVYAVTESNQYVINTLPSLDKESVVAIGVRVAADKTIVLKASELETFVNTSVVLEDLKTGGFIDLNQQPEYTFTQTASDSEIRFNVHVSKSTTAIEKLTSEKIRAYAFDKNMYLDLRNLDSASEVSVFDIAGKNIMTRSIEAGAIEKIHMQQGTYIVRVMNNGKMFSQKVMIQ